MKKFLTISLLAASLAACNDASTDTTTVEKDTMVTAPATTTTVTYTPAEGDVTYRDGKVMVWRDNDWKAAEGDVTLDNGVVVSENGHVKRDATTEVTLDDGEVVTRSGNFFDKTGDAVSDGWDATKHGVKKAGEAVGKAADAAKDAVVGDKDEK